MTTTQNHLTDRDLRQRDIIPAEALADTPCTVIGVGAIGRQVAIQLAAIGVTSLQLIDFDTVETVNLAPQGYLPEDLGQPKVTATAAMCRRILPDIRIAETHDRFRRSMPLEGAVFCCVDSIDTRRIIFEQARDQAAIFIDGRMSAEVIRVLAATPRQPDTVEHYPTTLFTEAQAFRGACTAKSTIYTAGIAAGLMVHQFTRYLRGMAVDAAVQMNLLAMELGVGES